MTDPLETLALADPARDRVPAKREAARMDAELHRLLASATPQRPRRRRARWLLAPVALAAALAALTLALPDRAPEVLQPEPASAATVLTQLSRKVAQAPAESGRYAYVKQLAYISHMRGGGKAGTYVMVVPHELEQWIADDGTAIMRQQMHEDQATFPTPRDKARFDAANVTEPRWDDLPQRQTHLEIGGFDYAEVQALPTDPAALRPLLEDTNVALTARAGQLLSSAATPTAVKVALFEVLKGLPGATLVEGVKDPLGRTGVGIEFDSPAWHTLFLFNPKTGTLLGTRSIGHKELPGRDISDWSLTVETGRTDTAPTTER